MYSTVGQSIASTYDLSIHIYLGASQATQLYISAIDNPTILHNYITYRYTHEYTCVDKEVEQENKNGTEDDGGSWVGRN